MSDLRTDLKRLGERAAPKTDAFERLERRRRRKERNRRIGAGALALVLVVGGSVAALSAFRDGQRSTPGGGGSEPTPGGGGAESPAAVAEFTCDGGGTIDPAQLVVTAQPDGVHVAVTATGDLPVSFAIGDVGGDGAQPGERAETVWQAAPGEIMVSCSVESPEFGGVATTANLTVVDPGGLYVGSALECASDEGYGMSPSFVEGATGFAGDPDQVVRDHVSGLEFDMQVEHAGYPESADPIVRIVRDGAVIGRVTLFDDGQGGWLPSSIEGCSGTQFGWSEEITGVTGPPADPGVVCLDLGLLPSTGNLGGDLGADRVVEGEDLGFHTHCLGVPAGERFTIAFLNLDEGVIRNISIYPVQECLIEAVTEEAAPPCDVGEPLFVGEPVTGIDEIVYEFGPLEPGIYYFQDDVHPSANGILVVS